MWKVERVGGELEWKGKWTRKSENGLNGWQDGGLGWWRLEVEGGGAVNTL